MNQFIVLSLICLLPCHGLRMLTTEKQQFKALIFHADDRAPSDKNVDEVTIEDMTFVELSSMVDYAYAEKHGYEFRHYVLPPSVSHPSFGKRKIHWAKLLAIKHAGDAYPDVDALMMHDSDTAITNHAPSLPEFMDAFTPAVTTFKDNEGYPVTGACTLLNNDEVIKQLKQDSSIWVNQGCRGHFVLVKPGEQAWKILTEAWNFPKFAKTFPYEQAAWDHLASVQRKGLMDIGGVNAGTADTAGVPALDTCDGTETEISAFNAHEHHFLADSVTMATWGIREARERIKQNLGCGAGWEGKCVDNKKYAQQLSDHDFHRGQRKLSFLNILKKLKYDDQEILRLYREMRARVVVLKAEDVQAVAAQLSGSPEDQLSLNKLITTEGLSTGTTEIPGNAQTKKKLEEYFPSFADPIPGGDRARTCWCDGP